MLVSRRYLHTTSARAVRKGIRRPTKIFPSPESTEVDKRGKFLTRGGPKFPDERKYANSRTRESVDTPSRYESGNGKVLGLTALARDRKVDPMKIAFAVEKSLNGSNREHSEGIELLKELSSQYGRKDLVVAWNHAIDWKMKRGNINEAMKLYNEMKKRGTKPDSYTYLRILDGLATNAGTVKSALGRALTVYYSMTAPTSTVKPSIIHTNAVLKVCAQAKDVDAMWDIAERIPEKGRGQADSVTYTTILNGMRLSVDGSPDRSITEGRELWENILLKWQEGHIIMDEGLGCAMARLLLRSAKPEDWDDVLSLVQDVFGVPRLIPRMGTKARKLLPIRDPKEKEKDVAELDVKERSWAKEESTSASGASAGELENNKDEMDNQVETEVESSTDLVPVQVDNTSALITSKIPATKPPIGNNGLSLLMEACMALRAYDTAQNYWDLVTESYHVIPDRDNFHNRMRLLSSLKDSSGCLGLIDEMVLNGIHLNQNLFFIALNGCRREGKVQGFKDALRLLDLMKRHDVEMTSKVIISFIRAAMVTDNLGCMQQAWMRLGPDAFNIHEVIDPTGKSVDQIGKDLESCQELVSLSDAILSRMYQDKLDRRDKEFADNVTKSRGKIQRYINDYFNASGLKTGNKEPTLIKQIKAKREEKRFEKERPKLSVESRVGRWTKLDEGEESLEGFSFKPFRRNSVAKQLGIHGDDQPRKTRSFMADRSTDYTGHFKPARARGNARANY